MTATEPVLSTLIDGNSHQLPDWALWFQVVGDSLAQWDEDGLRSWTCVTVPTRSFAAALAAFGSVRFAANRGAEDSLAERLSTLTPGDAVAWLDTNGEMRSGRFEGVDDTYVHYRPRNHGGIGIATKRPLAMAQDFYPLEPGEEPFAGARCVADNERFVVSALGVDSKALLLRSSVDVVICGTATQLAEELESQDFCSGGASGRLMDVIRPKRLLPAGQRWRSLIVTGSSRPSDVSLTVDPSVVVFDGAQAFLRLSDSIPGKSNLVILDRWSARIEESVAMVRIARNQRWVEARPPSIDGLPPGVETFSWVEES